MASDVREKVHPRPVHRLTPPPPPPTSRDVSSCSTLADKYLAVTAAGRPASAVPRQPQPRQMTRRRFPARAPYSGHRVIAAGRVKKERIPDDPAMPRAVLRNSWAGLATRVDHLQVASRIRGDLTSLQGAERAFSSKMGAVVGYGLADIKPAWGAAPKRTTRFDPWRWASTAVLTTTGGRRADRTWIQGFVEPAFHPDNNPSPGNRESAEHKSLNAVGRSVRRRPRLCGAQIRGLRLRPRPNGATMICEWGTEKIEAARPKPDRRKTPHFYNVKQGKAHGLPAAGALYFVLRAGESFPG